MAKKKLRAALEATKDNGVATEPVKDMSPHVHQRDKISFSLNIRERDDLTERQKIILSTMLDRDTRCVMIDGIWGTGKAQPLDAKILTPSGWATMGSLKVGDLVVGVDGLPTKVIGVFPQGEKDVYRVTFSDGAQTECCGNHLWLTQTEAERNRRLRKRNKGNALYTKHALPPKVRSLDEISKTLTINKHRNHSIPIVEPIHFEPKSHLIHPYILGCLIGDGGLTHSVHLTSADPELVERVRSLLPNDIVISQVAPMEYRLVRADGGLGMYRPNPFKEELKRLGLFGHKSYDKFIPAEYMFDSLENRIELLRGLMDTDGTYKGNYCSYSTSSKQLAKDIQFLVQSLGGTAVLSQQWPTYTYKGEKRQGALSYRISVKLDNEINPFHLTRKRNLVVPRKKYFPIRYFDKVELVGKKTTQCIMVDSTEHLYVTDDCIVTHNTTLATIAALKLLNTGRSKQILYVRNPIEASVHSRVGFLGGDLAEKMAPYTAVLHEKLDELLPKGDIDKLIKDERIQCIPTGFLQGRSFNCAAIIVDEAASMSWEDLMLIISRCGPYTRIFFLGDTINQVYLSDRSGYRRFFEAFSDQESRENGVHTFELKEAGDIVRSGFIRFVMRKVGVIRDELVTSAEPMFPLK